MKTVTVKRQQTLYDIALEQYGTCEAVGEILQLNLGIANDPTALKERGINSAGIDEFWFDVAVEPGSMLTVDPDSELRRSNIVKELKTDITTCENGTDN